MQAKLTLFFIIGLISVQLFAQEQQQNTAEEQAKHKVFANIYTGGYYNFGTTKPNAGFELSTGLLGYQYTKSDRVKLTLIYDVTRTTNAIQVTDSNGAAMTVRYFEGSKYTAFLKMGEIKWYFKPTWSIAAGQLLSEQYLTIQDKFWNHRYVMVTMQELFKIAYPADFGMRLAYDKKDKVYASFTAWNGDGPFKHQDELSVIDYILNFEYYGLNHFIFKGLVSLTPSNSDTPEKLKSSYSFFTAYKTDKQRFGIEYVKVLNPLFDEGEYEGVSAFGSQMLSKKLELFLRYDYVDHSPIAQYANVGVVGLQYQADDNVWISVNYRNWWTSEIQQLYFNFGAKF
ncbi:MAG: hypothetical protein JXR60_09395 [Bacteroidales bacterium]|nr:hypothetical protein [Bacteroidales bacterium]